MKQCGLVLQKQLWAFTQWNQERRDLQSRAVTAQHCFAASLKSFIRCTQSTHFPAYHTWHKPLNPLC